MMPYGLEQVEDSIASSMAMAIHLGPGAQQVDLQKNFSYPSEYFDCN